ncbi:hypothetical protein F4820DRAFT_448244 [Hypoxylon rubiginosum]|uniref:Uncharacterized protein n=1 Tax=Hypoxylon rubiginosum TaxID=110542 RepID=A0ACB9Z0C0_9PEZI|nr:hypothetical protein F4820DRAFT_448244 [Hypoxylon rubiginosum]
MADTMSQLGERAERLMDGMTWLAGRIVRDRERGAPTELQKTLQMFYGICEAFRDLLNDERTRLQKSQSSVDAERRRLERRAAETQKVEGRQEAERVRLRERSEQLRVELERLAVEKTRQEEEETRLNEESERLRLESERLEAEKAKQVDSETENTRLASRVEELENRLEDEVGRARGAEKRAGEDIAKLTVQRDEYKSCAENEKAARLERERILRDTAEELRRSRSDRDVRSGLEEELKRSREKIEELEVARDGLQKQLDLAFPMVMMEPRKRQHVEEKIVCDDWKDAVNTRASFLRSLRPILDEDGSCTLDRVFVELNRARREGEHGDLWEEHLLDFFACIPAGRWVCFEELAEHGCKGGDAEIEEGRMFSCFRHRSTERGVECFQIGSCNDAENSSEFLCRVRMYQGGNE